MNPQGVTQAVFVGQSPIEALMRSRDWSHTSLGDAASWSAALKTALGILLSAGTPMGCVWGCDRRVFYNDACAALLPIADLMGQPLAEAAGWAAIGSPIEQVFATGQSQSLAATQATSPLTANHSWACSAIWTEAGQVGGVLAIGTPSAQYSEAQQLRAKNFGIQGVEAKDSEANNGAAAQGRAALRESEERFRHLADNISQLAWMADASGSIFWYNQRWFNFTGTTLEQMQGWGWRQVHHPDHVDRVVEKVSHCFATGEVWEDTFPLRGKNGQYRWFLSRAIPVRDGQGRVLRWVGTNTDITDLRRTEKALEQTAKRLNIALKSAPITLFSQDHQLRYTWVYNPIHNYTLEQMIGRRDDDLVSSDAAARLRQLKQQVLNTGVGLRAEVEVEQAVFDLTIDPIRDRCDRVVGLTGAAVDISEREQLLQRERVAREEAEQANRLKDQFLAVLSHELRSPLNPILGWSKLLQTRSFDSDKTKRALATIERNAQLQAQLVDDLLDLARILRGKLHLTPMPVNLAGVVESALETVKASVAEKSIVLQLDLDRTVRVAGDAARLQQIVGNLLSNAVKFTPDSGQITVTLRSLDGQAEVSVQDTGIGISPDFLPYLFESFRQEDISITRRHGGLGLGLAIVRQLVEIHSGTITASSPGEGLGATFSVCLPQLAPEMADKAAALPRPVLDLSGIRVFSVDDSADTREFLTVLLGQYGADVVTAGSASEALARLETWRPDVLISDIGMPEIDGYNLIQQIRALPPEQGGDLPAIALTAYARYEDQQQSLASGYQRHLAKPLDPEKLMQAIIELTRGRA